MSNDNVIRDCRAIGEKRERKSGVLLHLYLRAHVVSDTSELILRNNLEELQGAFTFYELQDALTFFACHTIKFFQFSIS